MKRYWKRILLRFDRSFSTNKMIKPILWVVGFCVSWTLVFWLIGLAWGGTTAAEETGAVASERIVACTDGRGTGGRGAEFDVGAEQLPHHVLHAPLVSVAHSLCGHYVLHGFPHIGVQQPVE